MGLNGSDQHSVHRADLAWTWHAGGGSLIWQLMFPGEGMVAGMKRVPELRRASLFCIEASTGLVLADDILLMGVSDPELPAGEGWMTGLESTHGNLLFCHAYHPGSPEHLGIWAVEFPVGRVAWRRPEAIFSANLGSALLVYITRVFAGFPERDYYLIDPVSGEVIEHVGTDAVRANCLRGSASGEVQLQGIQLPLPVTEAAGAMELIDSPPFRIEGMHRQMADSGMWSSTIQVTAGGKPLYEDSMSARNALPLMNGYLIKGSAVYYIRENEELVCIQLS